MMARTITEALFVAVRPGVGRGCLPTSLTYAVASANFGGQGLTAIAP
jgi:hypothetical protein